MIASLTGKIVALDSTSAVVDVSGVGYLVQITQAAGRSLKLNENVLLYTSLIVREDAFTLFGFETVAEQKVFDLLRSVSGVGPKSALAILSELSVEQIIEAVSQENDAAFKAVSGVGPKTAKLISVTLAGKLGSNSKPAISTKNFDLTAVISALTGLGWNERSAIDAASQASSTLGAGANTNELLKAALSQLGSSKSIGSGDD